MKCPYCDSFSTQIIDSRMTKDGRRRRRYSCYDCGKRFTTYEFTSQMIDEEAIRAEERDNTFAEVLKIIRERRHA